LHAKMRADRIAVELGRAYFARRGGSRQTGPGGVMAFLKKRSRAYPPRYPVAVRRRADDGASLFCAPSCGPIADSFGCRAVLLATGKPRPHRASPHRIRESPSASAQNFPRHREGLGDIAHRRAPSCARSADSRPWRRTRPEKISPRPGLPVQRGDRRPISRPNRNHRFITPLGTCKMARGGRSHRGRRSRAQGLGCRRVAPSSMPSVMPDLIGGNINAAVIMIAEKGRRSDSRPGGRSRR